jgi:hypothetical protein
MGNMISQLIQSLNHKSLSVSVRVFAVVGHAVAYVTSQKVAGSTTDEVIGFFN